MSVNKYNSTTGELERISGGLLYADAPVGSIQAYGGTTAPSGWLLCQGQAVSRTEYVDLFKAIGTAFGAGDGSTTFNVPDLRETAPVGIGTRESGIETHDTYTLGQFKDDQLQNIEGTFRALSGNATNPFYEKSVVGETYAGTTTSSRVIGFNTSLSARTGTTTHGKQLGVNYIIKAKQVSVPIDIAEYIRNQNVLSEWETITIPTTAATAITMEYDGELYVNMGTSAGSFGYIYINGTQFAIGEAPSGGGGNNITFTILVKRGDVIYQSRSGSCKVAYYKLRDYTGR